MTRKAFEQELDRIRDNWFAIEGEEYELGSARNRLEQNFDKYLDMSRAVSARLS
jgi:hypothetical protein